MEGCADDRKGSYCQSVAGNRFLLGESRDWNWNLGFIVSSRRSFLFLAFIGWTRVADREFESHSQRIFGESYVPPNAQ